MENQKNKENLSVCNRKHKTINIPVPTYRDKGYTSCGAHTHQIDPQVAIQ